MAIPAATAMLDDELFGMESDSAEELRAQHLQALETIGKEVRKKIDESVTWRKSTGIEDMWREDDEYYHGIDDLNRGNVRFLKSAGMVGGLTKAKPVDDTRCTAFFNITRQFVDAGAARAGDILCSTGDWNFTMKPTPAPTPVSGGAVDSTNLPEQAMADLRARCERGETRIHDWLTECSYHAEVRKALESGAKLGTGILKGPVPRKRKLRKAQENGGRTTMTIVEDMVPRSYSVDIDNFFPAKDCGENFQDGPYCSERAYMSAKQLKALIGVPGYMTEQIEKVLDEGPNRKNYDADTSSRLLQSNTLDSDMFEVWYFYGDIPKTSLTEMEVAIDSKDLRETIPAIVTLVNETPIKAFLNPLDSGEFPYDMFPWQRVSGLPWGTGIARHGRTAQDMLNASMRNLMNNAGVACGPQVVIMQKYVYPLDGQWMLTPRKVWVVREDVDPQYAKSAIFTIDITMYQNEMNAIVQMAYKMMEDSTGILFIMQGQQGSAPDTVGGMVLLHQNASAFLRKLARTFDTTVTEPHIRRYHEWLILYGKDEGEKGDWSIEAVGSTALVDRDIQGMMAMQILSLSANPVYGIDPEKAAEEVLKASRFIPEKFKMDEERKKQLQTPGNPAVEVAQIRAEVERMKDETARWSTKISAFTAQRKMEVDTDRDNVYQRTMANRDAVNAQTRRDEMMMKRQLAIMDYANRRGIALDQVKADLANTAMKLRTQVRLMRQGKGPQVAEPPMEPPGRAKEGRAYVE